MLTSEALPPTMRELRREFLTPSRAQFPPCGNTLPVGGLSYLILRLAEQTLAAHARREQRSHRYRRYRCERLTANRRLDLTPNQGLSLPVRLRSSLHNGIGLVGEGLPLLLPLGAEAIGQTSEIVIIVQVSRTGISCSPHVAVLGLELRGLRGGDQSEIVFGVLKIVLRGDRVAARVSVARQLKVSFSHMQRTATNSDVRAVRVIRTSQGVGFATAICLAAATSVILTK